MLVRFLLFRRIAVILGLSVLLCSCASFFPGVPLRPETTVMGETDTLFARVHMTLSTAEGQYPLRAAVVARRPGFLRLELLPIIGTPDFFLCATPREMKIFIPSRGEFYYGVPSAENVARFLPWSFSIEDLVSILLGDYPALKEKHHVTDEKQSRADGKRTTMRGESGVVQVMFWDAAERLTAVVRHHPSGEELYEVRFEDYSIGTFLPGRITVRVFEPQATIVVKYHDGRIEKSVDLSVFELMLPEGIKALSLD
jgi:hypothetical protein